MMKFDKEMSPSEHPHHKLKLECTETPFNCDGCKEAGMGTKYNCQQCEFDLHKACAWPSLTITHPFYRKCEFQFYHQSPGACMRFCDACGNHILGFVYHCKECGFDLHPCCASLPQVLDDGETNLYLCHKLSRSCHFCGGKGSGWSYSSRCKTYSLHVACVKQMLMGMYVNQDKNGLQLQVRGMQRKIPRLRGTMKNHDGGKVRKCCEVAGTAIQLMVAAVLGDPTLLIAAVVGSFISK